MSSSSSSSSSVPTLNILLTNDDGISAQGLIHLARGLILHHQNQKANHDNHTPNYGIRVAAPRHENSGKSHSITCYAALFVQDYDFPVPEVQKSIIVDGTPADCVNFVCSVDYWSDGWYPDLVVSGINKGANGGGLITYSGTVGGALEGNTHRIPAIATSLAHPHHPTTSAPTTSSPNTPTPNPSVAPDHSDHHIHPSQGPLSNSDLPSPLPTSPPSTNSLPSLLKSSSSGQYFSSSTGPETWYWEEAARITSEVVKLIADSFVQSKNDNKTNNLYELCRLITLNVNHPNVSEKENKGWLLTENGFAIFENNYRESKIQLPEKEARDKEREQELSSQNAREKERAERERGDLKKYKMVGYKGWLDLRGEKQDKDSPTDKLYEIEAILTNYQTLSVIPLVHHDNETYNRVREILQQSSIFEQKK